MTDPSTADATYEPLTVDIYLEKVIQKENHARYYQCFGQTGLNLHGSIQARLLEKYNVELIGATEEIIDKAEDRDKFKAAMEKIGCNVPNQSRQIQSKNRLKLPKKLGFLVLFDLRLLWEVPAAALPTMLRKLSKSVKLALIIV